MIPIVLVDARNVLRSRWPNIPEGEVIERCAAWAAAEGVRVVVVFDGAAPDVLDEDPACAVVGTGRASADDWIADEAARFAASGQAYWLVTSDRELRERAGSAAARTIGGGSFARTI